MTTRLRREHLVAGDWLTASTRFENAPVRGAPEAFPCGSADLIDRAARAATDAAPALARLRPDALARFLDRIAAEIEARDEAICEAAGAETGLPAARLQGELARTTGQLRFFSAMLREGQHLEVVHTPGDPDRSPAPRPDLRRINRPIGPVAVFGASNFPLAFSVAGGDTASALAAGCPVVVKAHEAHPATSDLVAQAIDAARRALDLPPGVFSMVHGGDHAVGRALVTHPSIKAVGFTGSLRAGAALFDLCASRPEPIPFFGELGSINPVFILPGAWRVRPEALARDWAASLALGVGQFCTNPGLAVLPDQASATRFAATAAAALEGMEAAPMLTSSIAQACRDGIARARRSEAVTTVHHRETEARAGDMFIGVANAAALQSNPHLSEEVFGVFGLVLHADGPEGRRAFAQSLAGQLTATLHGEAEDHAEIETLLPILETKAGRILFAGMPTGVEVSASMVHGGPHPASTNAAASSVGALAIRRFLRPICLQDMPEALFQRMYG